MFNYIYFKENNFYRSVNPTFFRLRNDLEIQQNLLFNYSQYLDFYVSVCYTSKKRSAQFSIQKGNYLFEMVIYQ